MVSLFNRELSISSVRGPVSKTLSRRQSEVAKIASVSVKVCAFKSTAVLKLKARLFLCLMDNFARVAVVQKTN